MPTGVELTFNEDCLMVSEAARGRVVVVKLNDTNVASTQLLPGKNNSNLNAKYRQIQTNHILKKYCYI